MSVHYGQCQGGRAYVSRMVREPIYGRTGRVYFCPCWVRLFPEYRSSILEWQTALPND